MKKHILCSLFFSFAYICISSDNELQKQCEACLKGHKKNVFHIEEKECKTFDGRSKYVPNTDDITAQNQIDYCVCLKYTNCAACISVGNEICGWNTKLNKCVPDTNRGANKTCGTNTWVIAIIIPVVLICVGLLIYCIYVGYINREGEEGDHIGTSDIESDSSTFAIQSDTPHDEETHEM